MSNITKINMKQTKLKRKNKNDYGEDFKPPDGGWGWVVCVASGLSNLCTVPITQQFGLLFRDHFKDHHITNSQITTITNTSHAITALSEFLNAPFFRIFSYRQIALVGAVIISLGIFLTSFAHTFVAYLLIYSLLLGFGKGMNLSAKHIAFNVYFKERRGRGTSITVVISAIGPLFMSYLVLYLLDKYGLQGTILILTALSLNVFAFSLLYQPVKWHTKSVNKIENNNEIGSSEISVIKVEEETKNDSKENILNGYLNEDPKKQTLVNKIVKCFDLKLLKDFTYCNLVMGLTLSQFVESNFNMLTPFFLSDFGYSYEKIALIMTVSRIPDIVMRFLSPFIVERINWSNRVFWMISLTAMTIAEILIAQNPSFEVIFACFLWNGIFRGLRMIFNSIIIPDYVPLKQLPAASGLHRLVSGIFMLSCGPVIGMIRDATNYTIALLFLNTLSIITLISWTIELTYQYLKQRKKCDPN